MNRSILFGIVIFLLFIAGIWYLLSSNPALTPNQIINTNQPTIQQNQNEMSFFITSVNPGKGADLGGLIGADTFCQNLANNVGAGNLIWRAYLSATATNNSPAVNARDRIGNGPWKNFKGEIIANNLEELHGNNNLNKQTALTEKGEIVSGRDDPVNRHDILTGSSPDGRAIIAGNNDTTCNNWTSSTEGSAMLGHHDRIGLNDDDASQSWNSSHASRGCSNDSLASTGGAGLFYCFAISNTPSKQ